MRDQSMPSRPSAPPASPDAELRETLEVLLRLDLLWDELFPAEQARIVRSVVERVEIAPAGAEMTAPRTRSGSVTTAIANRSIGAALSAEAGRFVTGLPCAPKD